MSTLSEDLQVLDEAITTSERSVGPHMEIVEEQMRAAKVSGDPLTAMAELREAAQDVAEQLKDFAEALRAEGQTVGQAHSDSPDAARSGEYYDPDDD